MKGQSKSERFFLLLEGFIKFLKDHLGFLIVVVGYLTVLVVFVAGLLNSSLFDNAITELETGASTLTNRTLFWAVVFPIFVLTITFIGQAVFFHSENKKNIKAIQLSFEREIEIVKNTSEFFKAVNSVQKNDIYSSILFAFLLKKFQDDIELVNQKQFFASGMYWQASNAFIFSQDFVFCSCTLTPDQLSEPDITKYFDEQNQRILEKKLKVDRVLILKSINDINKYADYILSQTHAKIDIYLLAPDLQAISSLGGPQWNEMNRDFALCGNKFLLQAKIENEDLKGYDISEIYSDDSIPGYITDIKKYMVHVKECGTYWKPEHDGTKRIIAEKYSN